MCMVVEYENTNADYLAHHELVARVAYRSERSAQYKSLVIRGVLYLTAAILALLADQILLMWFFLALGGLSTVLSIPHSPKYWAAVKQLITPRPESHVRLEVRDDGLQQKVDGIEISVPWASIKGFIEFRATLFIELAAGLWAIVPRNSVSPGPHAVDDLLRVLRAKGIPESSNDSRDQTVHPSGREPQT